VVTSDALPRLEECTCLAVRQAARHISQFYDQRLAAAGLRTTQYSILGKLRRLGPMTINALADELVMDRTTLGRNILPLEREGLISVAPGRADRRSKELRLTEVGIERLRAARGLERGASPIRRGLRRRTRRRIARLAARSFGDQSPGRVRRDRLIDPRLCVTPQGPALSSLRGRIWRDLILDRVEAQSSPHTVSFRRTSLSFMDSRVPASTTAPRSMTA
jgi:DNA-binding MarR family transcriptional regulator